MEFDINLILVPVTLVFLLAYLADKLVLKQHKPAKESQKNLSAAEREFSEIEKRFKAVLKTHYGTDDPERFTPSDSTPSEVMTAHEAYHTARRHLAEKKSAVHDNKELFLVRWAYEYLPILAFLVVVRSFILEPFNIPSSSMVPSLYTGDFIVVNKSAYGLRLPIIHTKILDTGSPKHGDVVVFRYPHNEKRYYIKRVIGLPNDTIAFDNGVLSINGKAVDTKKSSFVMDDTFVSKLYPHAIDGRELSGDERLALGKEEEGYAHYYTETLGEHSYQVRYLADLNSAKYGAFLREGSPELIESNGSRWQITVPDGQYFVMGDNRDRSEDSRFWGFVEERHLAGKATYIWMHKDAGLSMPSFFRVGKID